MRISKSEDVPLKIAVTYVFVSLAYIYLSDLAVKLLNVDVEKMSRLQTIKGTGFVVLSGVLLFTLVNKYSRQVTRHYTNLMQERKRSFDELKISEEKYWTVFNASPLPMWIFDVDTLQFLLVNEAACRKYGYTAEEFSKMDINNIRPAEDVPKLLRAVKESKNTKHTSWPHPYTHLCKNGDRLQVKIESAEIVFDGRIARLIIATDVTEKVKNDEIIAEANLRLKSASDIASLGYWSHDLRTAEIYWSDTLFTIFEMDRDKFSLTWENVQKVFIEGERHNFELNKIFADDEVKEFEHRIQTAKGNEKWILERVSLLRNDDGTPIFIEGIALDITERKRALKELKRSNERFEMVAKAAVEAIIDWDIQANEVFWGDGLQELFGYDPKTSNRALWMKNIHPADRSRVIENLNRALSDPDSEYFIEDFRFMKANGQVAFVQHRGVFVRDSNGVAIRAVGAMIDMTQLKEKIIKIEEQNHRLREIAWIQSHVVRAPLATLMGLMDLLKNSSQYGLEPTEIINGIVDSANKLDDIIRDIVKRTEQIG